MAEETLCTTLWAQRLVRENRLLHARLDGLEDALDQCLVVLRGVPEKHTSWCRHDDTDNLFRCTCGYDAAVSAAARVLGVGE